MNLHQVLLALPSLCFFNAFISASYNPNQFNNDVSINCGSSGTSAAQNGREWSGDINHSKFSSLLRQKGPSTASTAIHKLRISADDPVPYKTARLSHSQFSYAFQVNSGQKIIRLQFNPGPYRGFKRFKDLFTVEAGPFTLLSNFSASLTADALGMNSFVKEFVINMEESQEFCIVFTPASSKLLDTYAFVNGIEIIPVPASLSYFHRGDIGVQVVGKKSLVYVDNTTALEIIQQINIKEGVVSSAGDMGGMFGMGEMVTGPKTGKINLITWKIPVDVGFKYLVRLHFSKAGLKMAEIGSVIFEFHINEMIADTNIDIVRAKDDENRIPRYRDYLVMMKGSKQEGKRDLLIFLQSNDEFFDDHGPLKGFEIMKLSNPDNSVASPNPMLVAKDSSYRTAQNLLQVVGHRNAIAAVIIVIFALVNIIIYTLTQIRESSSKEEENKPSARAERLCRRFSLVEIQLATRNFSDAHFIGKGGFGKVYKGHIDNGRETVAIKRLKSSSKQGAREFLTEIETLTELRHDNLVSLIGYCNEHREMILVYEYIACGTLADHLYKFARNDHNSSSLTWKQRLNVCIGAARGLEYLHTGKSLIHRDVKASNILLDEDCTAKVSDFGLAKPLSRSKLQSHVSTKVKGTFGYFDPNYLTTGKLTKKSDTYAFGVVLLEVLSGRPALDPIAAEDERILIKWARENISEGKTYQIVASDLRGEVSEDSLKAFVGVAERCLHYEPKKRPTMAEVVQQLVFALEQQESSESPCDVDDIHPSKDDTNLSVGSGSIVVNAGLLRRITHTIDEVEDIMDAYMIQAAESRSKNYFFGHVQRPIEMLLDIVKEVRVAYDDTTRIEYGNLNVGDVSTEVSEAPPVRQDSIVVGFEDEAEKIIGYLTEETKGLGVISIIGMPGLGKTMLAGKIFRDPEIQYQFPIRIWVHVSQDLTRKDVFLAILRELTTLTEDMYCKTDEELAQLVTDHLEIKKFLIVMDDVRTAGDWEEIKIALPNSDKRCKVLITSRHEEVAWHANRKRPPHKLRFLNQDESWLLLQRKVFGMPDQCPSELEVVGKLIAEHCGGLPLAIVVIGGILVQRFSKSGEMSARRNAWRKVSESMSAYLNEDPERRMKKIISLSYDNLPFHLRACFLYLGMFPEDFEIPVWKLIHMWIAEGLIKQKPGISLEENAESYLQDLISRNLLRVDKMRLDGRVKTCRIHEMLRDFCKTEAGNEMENFLHEMEKSGGGGFYPLVSEVQKFRRICIHSNVLKFLSAKPLGPRVRSFVCFSKEDITLPSDNISAIPSAFKLLRVLDVKPIKFTKIPSDIYHLVHLRYIALSFDSAILPAAFSKLFNLEILIVDTTSRTLEIKADLWEMVQLRHFKTNACATLPRTGKSSEEGAKLQTLGTISPRSCTEEVFRRARNLRKLSIRGWLGLLLDGKSTGSFDCLGKLSNLEKLKLLNDVFPSPPSDGQLSGLPPSYKFPSKLRSLTLSGTFLDWSHMSILGLLENLEVLKLKDKAFMGEHWLAADGGFRHLEVLHIARTDLVLWAASGHHFPRLRRLELQNCEQLQEIPIGLADIPSLQLLDLYRCSKSAAASARKIYEAKKRQRELEKTTTFNEFKLPIFPDDRLLLVLA